MSVATIVLRTTGVLLFIAASATTATAQIEVGVKGGISFTDFDPAVDDFYGYPAPDTGGETAPPTLRRDIEGWLSYLDYWESALDDLPPLERPGPPPEEDWQLKIDKYLKDVATSEGQPGFVPELRPIDPVRDLAEDIFEEFDDVDDRVDAFFEALFGSCDVGGIDDVSASGFYVGGIGNDRGIMATETGTTRVIPGYVVAQTLNGWGIEGSVSTCARLGSLPTYFSLGGDYRVVSGSTTASNVPFIEGFGITGVGVTPGVFINSPTDITSLRFDTQRNDKRLMVQIDQAIFSRAGFRGKSDGSWSAMTHTVSLIGGMTSGRLTQNEVIELGTLTPAFPIGTSTVRQETFFNGMFAGVYAGASLDAEMVRSNGLRTFYGVSGTVGVDYYSLTVDDRVTANGLGGLLNFSQSNQIHYTLPSLTATSSVYAGVGVGNIKASLFAGIETGTSPSIDYRHPDSLNGVAANPTLAFVNDIGFNFGGRISGSW